VHKSDTMCVITDMQTEVGHQFWRALNSQPKIPRGVSAIPSEFTLALAVATSQLKARIPGVFFSGRMYSELTTGSNGETIYQNVDPWRDKAVLAAESAGVLYLDGVGWDLNDPAMNAGKALFNVHMAPVLVVNAIGRVGSATHYEATMALAAGSNVGIIVPHEEYRHTVAFLKGETTEYPSSLPAWWGSLDLAPWDVVDGFEQLPTWIRGQMEMLTPAAFRARTLPLSALAHMMLYGHVGLAQDEKELRLLDQLLSKVY
jgi:hypothetical protein